MAWFVSRRNCPSCLTANTVAGPGGVVVVAVGGGHRLQDFLRPLFTAAIGQHGDDL